MKIEILSLAEQDLLDGNLFYERQTAGLGNYFLENIYLDIETLKHFAGIHLKPHRNIYRLLSKKFPFAIYYTIENNTSFIHAEVDYRRNPEWIKRHLT
ncbi:MAG: type II toxin-antitoxin system RelE/ParE family toxin [Verrucomicrobiota bacterium]